MDDILTVMDDAGIERAVVFGWQSGATHAALLAATYPDRVSQPPTRPAHARWRNPAGRGPAGAAANGRVTSASYVRAGEPVSGSSSMSPSGRLALRP